MLTYIGPTERKVNRAVAKPTVAGREALGPRAAMTVMP